MSHAATNWAIKQRGLKPATKIVLWHLADCHNGHTGQCNPKQSTLADLCEMSRSTVNLHLNKLEELGLIRRIQNVDSETQKKRPTHYILSMDEAEKPMSEIETRPENPVSENPTDTPEAVSEKQPKPCPKNEHSRVRNSDIKNLGKEPGKEPIGDFDAGVRFCDFWAIWPNKVSKQSAEKAWKKLKPDERTAAAGSVEDWFSDWRRKYPQASPIHPATYLNGKRWTDETSHSQQSPTPERAANINRWRNIAGATQ